MAAGLSLLDLEVIAGAVVLVGLAMALVLLLDALESLEQRR
jgi:hypothetical protein